MKPVVHQLKEIVIQVNSMGEKAKVRDSLSVIVARAFLLFVLTFDLFLNAYVLMSLDINNLLIGTLTIVTSAVGQFSAITGQFGYTIGSKLLKLFLLLDLGLIAASLLLDQFEENFMTEISFVLTLIGCITGCFIVVKEDEKQLSQSG